ncbi:aromatic ring-hydroxylating oxygenase subunit alpha [Sphingomonas sp. MMS24-JH45]
MQRSAELPYADPDADWSLPAWLHRSRIPRDRKTARILRPSWQIVCHQSDLAEPGAWRTLAYLGENIVVVRGTDGAIRGFHNVCRHRAMRLVEGDGGCAAWKLVCPYHAWAYELDGRLTGVPMRADYPALDMAATGLVPVEVDSWRGFVFVRLEDDGGPSVAQMMAPYDDEVAPYRFEDMRRIGDVRTRERAVSLEEDVLRRTTIPTTSTFPSRMTA